MTESSTNLNWAASDKLKDSGNYSTWKILVKHALINAGVYQFVLGKGKGLKPTTTNEDYDEDSEYGKWLKGNAKAYTILHRTCGTDAMRTIKSTNNAAKAWTLLKDRYEVKGFSLIGQSLDEFLALSYEKSRDIATFNALFKDLKRKIEDAGLSLQATFYIHLYLKWVSPAFPTWAERQRSVLRTTSTTTSMLTNATLDDMMADLIDENRAVTAQGEDGTGISMYGDRPHPQNRKGNSNSKKPNTQQLKPKYDRHCTHCNKNGHLEQNCCIKHPEKKTELLKNQNIKDENTNSKTKTRPLSMMGHKSKSIKSSDWILVTSASHHMCNDRTLFDEYRVNMNPANTITTAGGNTRAEGYGTVTITAIQTNNSRIVIKLLDVFHVPSLGVNLLSGPTLKKKGVYIDSLTNTIRHESDKSEVCKFQLLDSAMRICTVSTGQATNGSCR